MAELFIREMSDDLSEDFNVRLEGRLLIAEHKVAPIKLQIEILNEECVISIATKEDPTLFIEEFIEENSIEELEDFIDDLERTIDRISLRISDRCKVERDLRGILDLRDALENYIEESLG